MGRTRRCSLVSFVSRLVSNELSLSGGDEEGGAAWCAARRGTSQTSTHCLEGRKREERLGELRIVARHKPALTSWRGGRGRSGTRSIHTLHVTNEPSLCVGEEESGMAEVSSTHDTRTPHTPTP